MPINNDNDSKARIHEGGVKGFFAALLTGLLRDAFKLIVAFAVGTGASALVCWYYGIPLAVSILGGILVLGLALALMSDSLFS